MLSLALEVIPLARTHADPARGKQNWVISGEGLGRSIYASLNVDRSIGERWSVGGGYGTTSTALSLSAYANAYLAGEYLALYITGGVSGHFLSGYSEWYAWPGVGAEYRSHQGPTIRAALYHPIWLDNPWNGNSPYSTSGGVLFWPGFSLGWCF